MKIDSQPNTVSSRPPISGPNVGATTITVATSPIIEAARSRSNRSRMMARPTTMPAEAPSACRMRATISAVDRRHRRSPAGWRATVSAKPGEHHRPAAEAVRQRPHHKLRDGEPEQDRATP